mgnify:CR=1 FL=1
MDFLDLSFLDGGNISVWLCNSIELRIFLRRTCVRIQTKRRGKENLRVVIQFFIPGNLCVRQTAKVIVPDAADKKIPRQHIVVALGSIEGLSLKLSFVIADNTDPVRPGGNSFNITVHQFLQGGQGIVYHAFFRILTGTYKKNTDLVFLIHRNLLLIADA